MSASIGNYLQVDATFRGSNNVQMVINPAKAQADLTTIKERFYLDDVIGFEANYAGILYHGFWGTCRAGSPNETMHKTSRIVEVHGDTFGESKRTFNDSGLNTKGVVTAPSIGVFNTPGNLPEMIQYSGQVYVEAFYKSAWYVQTDSYGFYMSINGGAFTKVILGTIIGASGGLLYSGASLNQSLKFGDNFIIDLFLDNAEGEYRASAGSYQVNAGAILNVWVASYASWACNHINDAAQTTLYTKTYPISPGLQVYYDKTCALGTEWNYKRGLSMNGDWYVTDNDGIISAVGICGGSYPSDDPASILYDAIVFRYFEIDVINGCLFAGGGNSQNITVYQNRVNQKYYSAPGFANAGGTSGWVQDGYYWVSIGANALYYIIQSGVQVGLDTCTF